MSQHTQDEQAGGDGRHEGEPRPHRASFSGRLRQYFLAGVLVTAPSAITLYVVWAFVALVDNAVKPLFPVEYRPETYLPFPIPGLGLILVAVGLTVIGWAAAGFFGRYVVRVGERFVARMPVVRSVYGAVKQIVETVFAKQSQAFRQVVLFEYPRRGTWALGFITGITEGEVQNLTSDEVVNVFLPTTPNPTSGYLLFVPRRDVIVLDMTVEEGIKMVVSGGMITPPDRRALALRRMPRTSTGMRVLPPGKTGKRETG